MIDSVNEDPMSQGFRESGLLSSFRIRTKKRQCELFILELSVLCLHLVHRPSMWAITSVHQNNALPSSSADGWGQVTSLANETWTGMTCVISGLRW